MRIVLIALVVASMSGCVGVGTLAKAGGQVGEGLQSGFKTMACSTSSNQSKSKD